MVSESLKGLVIMVILERVKGEPSGNKVFKDFVYRNRFNYQVNLVTGLSGPPESFGLLTVLTESSLDSQADERVEKNSLRELF